MDNSCNRHAQRRLASAVLMLLTATLVPTVVLAANAHQAQYAKPGEIVLLRNVATRPADRPPPSPGLALLVDPSPRTEINGALGTGELSDADYASLGANPMASQTGHASTTVERVVGNALGNSLGGNVGGNGTVTGNGMSNVISGPMGAVGSATRGIGDQVTGALSQIPMPGVPAGGGH